MDIFIRTLEFTIPVITTILVGLFTAGFLSELGVLSSISSLARPLVVIANLPEVCASSFVLSLGSTVAANGMIARFREDGLVEDREVFLCAMINSIPAYIREIFTYQIPVVIPALGLAAGSIYGLIFMGHSHCQDSACDRPWKDDVCRQDVPAPGYSAKSQARSGQCSLEEGLVARQGSSQGWPWSTSL